MSLLADALQPHVARGLFSIRGAIDATLDELMARQGCYPSFDTAAGHWEFDFRAPESVSPFLAYECARFACASFQSYADVKSSLVDANRLPWALVKAYYAAFYAGHSILRALGITCTYVDGPRVTLLRRLLQAYGIQLVFSSGLYHTRTTATASSIRFESLGQGHGGTHEAFWKIFALRIQSLEVEVLAGSLPRIDAQSVNLALGKVRAVITRNSSDLAWLSTVRNAVQYRQGHQVWYPTCGLSAAERSRLSQIADSWLLDPMAIDVPARRAGVLGDFLSACTFLVASCRVLMIRIGQRGNLGQRKSFAYHGPLRYLLTHKLWKE